MIVALAIFNVLFLLRAWFMWCHFYSHLEEKRRRRPEFEWHKPHDLADRAKLWWLYLQLFFFTFMVPFSIGGFFKWIMGSEQ